MHLQQHFTTKATLQINMRCDVSAAKKIPIIPMWEGVSVPQGALRNPAEQVAIDFSWHMTHF